MYSETASERHLELKEIEKLLSREVTVTACITKDNKKRVVVHVQRTNNLLYVFFVDEIHMNRQLGNNFIVLEII